MIEPTYLQGRTVAVTGADGFIGSHLVEQLARSGAQVRALAWYNAFGDAGWLDDFTPDLLAHVDITLGDIRDQSQIRRWLEGTDIVWHLAALIGIPYSYHAPESYLQTNVIGTQALLSAAHDVACSRVVVVSTSEVYGTARQLPMSEDHPLHAQSPYAASKIAADQLTLSYCAAFDLPAVIVRPFNTYGPRQSIRAVIPTIIRQLSAGNDLKLGNTAARRDLTYVTDTVDGLIRAGDPDRMVVGDTINLGTGHDVSVEEIAHTIARDMGRDLTIVVDDKRLRPDKSEVDRLRADNRRASERLEWQPSITLEDGLRQTIAWFQNPDNLRRYGTRDFSF